VGAELFHVDGQTDMTELTVAFRNFSGAPKMATLVRNKCQCSKQKPGGLANHHNVK
jgi:hypothetical protein